MKNSKTKSPVYRNRQYDKQEIFSISFTFDLGNQSFGERWMESPFTCESRSQSNMYLCVNIPSWLSNVLKFIDKLSIGGYNHIAKGCRK